MVRLAIWNDRLAVDTLDCRTLASYQLGRTLDRGSVLLYVNRRPLGVPPFAMSTLPVSQIDPPWKRNNKTITPYSAARNAATSSAPSPLPSQTQDPEFRTYNPVIRPKVRRPGRRWRTLPVSGRCPAVPASGLALGQITQSAGLLGKTPTRGGQIQQRPGQGILRFSGPALVPSLPPRRRHRTQHCSHLSPGAPRALKVDPSPVPAQS